MLLRNVESIRQTSRKFRRDGLRWRRQRSLLRQSPARKQESFSLQLDVHFITLGSEKWSLLHTHCLKVFEHAQCMDAVNQNDRVAGAELDLAQPLAFVAVKFNDDAAALHHEHLLEIGHFARERFVIMWRFGETGLVSEETELKRRFRRREEARVVHAHAGANHLGVFHAVVADHFRGRIHFSDLSGTTFSWRRSYTSNSAIAANR